MHVKRFDQAFELLAALRTGSILSASTRITVVMYDVEP